MDIDQIFLEVTELLSTVPTLKWIDMDFGQLDSEQRPPVAFPCALVSIDLPDINDLGNKVQKAKARINIKMAFDYAGETSIKTAPDYRTRALAYYGTVKDVYKKLHGARLESTAPLKRITQMEYARPDRIKIVEMPFDTVFVDESAR